MTDSNIQPAKDEWERMLSGELYVADNPKQHEMNMRKRRLVQAINTSAYDAFEERDRLFHELFGSLGKDGFLEPPFNCDYGCNTYIGDNFYANMDCIFLDVARITIGDRVFFGPRVGLYTPYHPIDAAVRASGPEGARPITIGNDVWFGGNVVVGPGVTIGDDVSVGHCATVHGATIGDRVIVGMGATVLDGAVIGNDCIIGAGALVTGKMNAPDGSMILGSPAKVVGELTDKEKESILANAALYLEKSKEYRAHAAKQA